MSGTRMFLLSSKEYRGSYCRIKNGGSWQVNRLLIDHTIKETGVSIKNDRLLKVCNLCSLDRQPMKSKQKKRTVIMFAILKD